MESVPPINRILKDAIFIQYDILYNWHWITIFYYDNYGFIEDISCQLS